MTRPKCLGLFARFWRGSDGEVEPCCPRASVSQLVALARVNRTSWFPRSLRVNGQVHLWLLVTALLELTVGLEIRVGRRDLDD